MVKIRPLELKKVPKKGAKQGYILGNTPYIDSRIQTYWQKTSFA